MALSLPSSPARRLPGVSGSGLAPGKSTPISGAGKKLKKKIVLVSGKEIIIIEKKKSFEVSDCKFKSFSRDNVVPYGR